MAASIIILVIVGIGLLWAVAKKLADMETRDKKQADTHVEFKIGVKDDSSSHPKE